MPGHPSAADEVWHQPKHVLHGGKLYITSRPAFFQGDVVH